MLYIFLHININSYNHNMMYNDKPYTLGLWGMFTFIIDM
jgi:hypothetical protein